MALPSTFGADLAKNIIVNGDYIKPSILWLGLGMPIAWSILFLVICLYIMKKLSWRQ